MGVGEKYKNCCRDGIINDINNDEKFSSICEKILGDYNYENKSTIMSSIRNEQFQLEKKFNGKKRKCTHFDCEQNSIKSHLITKSTILKELAFKCDYDKKELKNLKLNEKIKINNAIIYFDKKINKINIKNNEKFEANFDISTIKKATTFYGFCEKHDSTIFSSIELSKNYEFKQSVNECFLRIYRIFAWVNYKILNQLDVVESCLFFKFFNLVELRGGWKHGDYLFNSLLNLMFQQYKNKDFLKQQLIKHYCDELSIKNIDENIHELIYLKFSEYFLCKSEINFDDREFNSMLLNDFYNSESLTSLMCVMDEYHKQFNDCFSNGKLNEKINLSCEKINNNFEYLIFEFDFEILFSSSGCIHENGKSKKAINDIKDFDELIKYEKKVIRETELMFYDIFVNQGKTFFVLSYSKNINKKLILNKDEIMNDYSESEQKNLISNIIAISSENLVMNDGLFKSFTADELDLFKSGNMVEDNERINIHSLLITDPPLDLFRITK